ncbi:13261_t:CDS:2 [Acaulospora colombiana]|uniref:13261_t:CDS:1 n=1 Tax=Acaulospora colombiana TaxID=27376 RepID=A0ACA9KY24_9GLOM|nr:13261_t:CDS:2 [Acaulospora colombiana]
MSSKPRPVVPPKPARLSVNSQGRHSTSSVTNSATTTPIEKISLCESPPSTSLEHPSDDRTPRASEIFSSPLECRQARALYDFEGEPSFQELSFRAGDVFYVLKEQLSEGWSLAEKDGIKGLVPEAYLTYTTEFTELPNSTLSGTLSSSSDRDSINSAEKSPMKNGSVYGSMYGSINGSTHSSSKIVGKRQLNRFSWFVTTGVEEFILNGGQPEADVLTESEDNEEITESDKHYIQGGPTWQEKAPNFKIMVHDPEKRVKLGGVQEYTVFYVTSMFSGVQVTVERRYSQFEWLYNLLVSKFGCFVLPKLPEKQYSGRFNEEFIEKRRRALERYDCIVLIRYSSATSILKLKVQEWNRREKEFESDKLVGRAFFSHVYHPEFNVDDGQEL